MIVNQYRKKLVVEAVQFTGDNVEEILNWGNGQIKYHTRKGLRIPYLAGWFIIKLNWWVVKYPGGQIRSIPDENFATEWELI